MNDQKYQIEPYADGYLVADYSGNRGAFGAAYAGRDGWWHDMPLNLDPFPSKETAETFAKSSVK